MNWVGGGGGGGGSCGGGGGVGSGGGGGGRGARVVVFVVGLHEEVDSVCESVLWTGNAKSGEN